MNDITSLLDAAGSTTDARVSTPEADRVVSADLARGRNALRRQRGRRVVLGVAPLVATGALVWALVPGPSVAPSTPPSAGSGGSSGPAAPLRVELVAADVTVAAFHFGVVPRDWVATSNTNEAALFSAPGVRPDPTDDWATSLVISFAASEGHETYGTPQVSDGRTFYVFAGMPGDGHGRVSVKAQGATEGWVEVQYPTDAGFSQADLIRFAGSVTVTGSVGRGVG